MSAILSIYKHFNLSVGSELSHLPLGMNFQQIIGDLRRTNFVFNILASILCNLHVNWGILVEYKENLKLYRSASQLFVFTCVKVRNS